jgi:hypothetical protein|tara:strand:+ start:545 stop:754 length:210 start_codon:yes stop_codon:yes gene_type:complete
MISKKTLKAYEFKQIENYFDYMDESIINGNFQQVKDLFNKLSKSQQKLCYRYFNRDDRKDTLNHLINNI